MFVKLLRHVELMREEKETIVKEDDYIFDDNREVKVREKEEYIKSQLCKLAVRRILGAFTLTDVLVDFDATSLYPSAMWEEQSIYPKNETHYAFTSEMNDGNVRDFNTQNFYTR